MRAVKIVVDASIADGSIVSKDERGILDRAFELAEDIIPRLELLDVELPEDVQDEMLGARHSNTKDESYYTRTLKNTPITPQHYISWFNKDCEYISRTPTTRNEVLTNLSPIGAVYGILSYPSAIDENHIQIEKGNRSTDYEPYTESNAYVVAKDGDEIAELRSLPNGTKDEVRLSEGKAIIRIGAKTNVASSTVINYTDMADGGQFVAYYEDGTQQVGIKGDTLTAIATTLIYQLAEPVEIPVQVSGNLISYPSGTIYVEPVVADAGVYTDKMEVLHQDLPIKAIENVSKVDFLTGVETELDIDGIVIAEDKFSFTHPDLLDGDIVFFEYEYDVESTQGEAEVEFYDSRYVVKDTETGKFYKWNIVVANGQPSIELVEV